MPTEMTPEQKRIAIAKVCKSIGWAARMGGMFCYNEHTGERFDPLDSLDAMAQAEATLSEQERSLYASLLGYLTRGEGIQAWQGSAIAMWLLLHATASQRADAFLKVKGIL